MYLRQVENCGILNPAARLPVPSFQSDLQRIGVEKVVCVGQVMRESTFAVNSHCKVKRFSAGFLNLSRPCPFGRRQGQESALQFSTVAQFREYETRFTHARLAVCWSFVGWRDCSLVPCCPPLPRSVESENADLD